MSLDITLFLFNLTWGALGAHRLYANSTDAAPQVITLFIIMAFNFWAAGSAGSRIIKEITE